MPHDTSSLSVNRQGPISADEATGIAGNATGDHGKIRHHRAPAAAACDGGDATLRSVRGLGAGVDAELSSPTCRNGNRFERFSAISQAVSLLGLGRHVVWNV